MSTIAALINLVLADALVPALKAAEYRRDGRTWRRRGAEAIRVLNVQTSRSNDATEGRFTMNVGLYFPALQPFIGPSEATERPTDPDCHVRERIGSLLPTRQDHWWHVTRATDPATLARQVHDAWANVAAPWFEEYDNLEAARLLVGHQHPCGELAVSLALGDRTDASRRLRTALAAAAGRKNLHGILRSWGQYHGLLVSDA